MENTTHIPPEMQHARGGAPPSQSDGESLRAGYEVKDAQLKPIVIFIVVLAVSAAAIHGAVYVLQRLLVQQNEKSDPTPSPFYAKGNPNPPPEPRLQPSPEHNSQPVEDMMALRLRWHQELTSYGPVDGQPQRARIPIDRAMQLAVERGVPKASPAPATQPATRPAGGGA
jgi:hypothetical protein